MTFEPQTKARILNEEVWGPFGVLFRKEIFVVVLALAAIVPMSFGRVVLVQIYPKIQHIPSVP